jgi:hypothetical protein
MTPLAVRISARRLPVSPLRNAATVTSCKYPALLVSILLPENQAEYVRNQRQAYTAQNGGHGGAARPRSRRGYGSLSESAVEPEPASESVATGNTAQEAPSHCH